MQHPVLNYAPAKPGFLRRIAKLAWRCRRPIYVLACFMLVYIGTYIPLSLRGRYEPDAISLGGVVGYCWAPAGFVSGFRWNRSCGIFFFPLHQLDRLFWHVDDGAWSGKYPVHEPTNIEDVYRAWK